MLNLKPIIDRITALLNENTDASVTYAALEARLALEKICYNRLRQRHKYISHVQLRKWQPNAIMNMLMEEVDPHVAQTMILSISKNPVQDDTPLEDHDYVEIGTQIGFDPKKISRLWNALGGLALHVRLPKSSDDHIPAYGDRNKIRAKIEEVIKELDFLAKTTMEFSGVGEEVSFTCSCGETNRRRVETLRDGQHVYCINFDCKYTWKALKKEDQFEFESVTATVVCSQCKIENELPWRVFLHMQHGQFGSFCCHTCKHKNYVTWRLMQGELPEHLA
jgi:putative ubiquitin-RnfH superfamily antitoxin RatB of RatAB toxin-antitoxin module